MTEEQIPPLIEETPAENKEEPTLEIEPSERYSVGRVRFGLALTLIGFMLFILGARPSTFGLDRSPVIGFVQIAVFLVGLAIITLGGYISLMGLWGKRELSLLADIGSRLVATGFVICVFSGMADIFGFGSHLPPNTIPYFGDWQVLGVEIGQIVIGIGLVLMIPFHRTWKRENKAKQS